ncbi:MAG: DUF4834 domain-containing protein [Flavobacteriales bacterium]|jgi:hypothetical protein|nr:DUF4834 domain-containing protein [Flavobacteriales bacterium]
MLIGLLKFLFWFFVISYLIRFLGRVFLPIMLKRFINKSSEKFKQQYDNMDTHSSNKEGEITIESNKTSSDSSNDVGDYVDFEEVDE